VLLLLRSCAVGLGQSLHLLDIVHSGGDASTTKIASRLSKFLQSELAELWVDMEAFLVSVVLPVIKQGMGLMVGAAIIWLDTGYTVIFIIAALPIVPSFLLKMRIYWDSPESPVSLLYVCLYDVLFNAQVKASLERFVRTILVRTVYLLTRHHSLFSGPFSRRCRPFFASSTSLLPSLGSMLPV
jgi:hypothetical protein